MVARELQMCGERKSSEIDDVWITIYPQENLSPTTLSRQQNQFQVGCRSNHFYLSVHKNK